MKDFNGDGFDDVAISTITTQTGNTVEVLNGSPTGLDDSSRRVLRVPLVPGNTRFGHVVQTAGDVNGDGYADLAVGAGDEVGRAEVGGWLFLGGRDGLPPLSYNVLPVRLNDPQLAVAAGFDVNGDGFSDLVTVSLQVVQLHFGGPSGINLTPRVFQKPHYGVSTAAGAGDFNADGYGDILVGSPIDGMGKAFLFLGGPDGPGPRPVLSYPGADSAGSFIGTNLWGGVDFNGDGRHDITIGTAGIVYLYYGGERLPDPSAYRYLLAREISVGPGPFVNGALTAGDLNGDGLSDLAIGAPFAPGTDVPVFYRRGSVYVFHGTAAGLSEPPDVTLRGPETMGGFGSSVAIVGDIHRDGWDDIAVGIFSVEVSHARSRVHVFRGSPIGIRGAYDQELLNRMPESGGYFGYKVASLFSVSAGLIGPRRFVSKLGRAL